MQKSTKIAKKRRREMNGSAEGDVGAVKPTARQRRRSSSGIK
jgi:hypothetical protein